MFRGEQSQNTDRVRFELRATGVRQEASNPLHSGIHTRGYLPHVKREGACYFVTFRLADSLPGDVLQKCQAERAERIHRFHVLDDLARKKGSTPPKPDTLDEIEREYFRGLEAFLDRGMGECCLRTPGIALIVSDAIRYFDGQRYRLDSWVVMPNHVHLVLWPMPNHSLSKILQSLKRFTAREANKMLQRTGQEFWQPESYDHWIRNDEEHTRCCRYVVNNPVKARLCQTPEQWGWSSAWRRIVPEK
jgi:REP element-mobilizing transposase RayT